ncbi:Inositol phosphate phosphatase IpgD [Pandoraea iniqua]|uniref:Inositol phosphate phosphatase IpgD n=1 Tax=Pandoraea iniqua TaxID=2508288 RepID=A0A5E4YF39_9BURK|nr:inositol phosphate phosphatase SopB [Pandoraea iniqua]VVE47082.1 Inositol phosphate phosphatase IpgD [Pandoraea iniqua]
MTINSAHSRTHFFGSGLDAARRLGEKIAKLPVFLGGRLVQWVSSLMGRRAATANSGVQEQVQPFGGRKVSLGDAPQARASSTAHPVLDTSQNPLSKIPEGVLTEIVTTELPSPPHDSPSSARSFEVSHTGDSPGSVIERPDLTSIDSAQAADEFAPPISASCDSQSIEHLNRLDFWNYQCACDIAREHGVSTDLLSKPPCLDLHGSATSLSAVGAMEDGASTASETDTLNPSSEANIATGVDVKRSAHYPAKLLEQLGKAGIDPQVAHTQMHRSMCTMLNQQEWQQIEKPIVVGQQTFISRMTPASELSSLKESYARDGIRGVTCAQRERVDHAVNLWQSALIDPDGKTLFQGIRHAANAPHLDRPEQALEAHAGALARASEVVLAALELDSQRWEQALQGEIVELRMTSISLMTPTRVATHEAKYLDLQLGAWEAFNRESQTKGYASLPGPDGTPIKVKLQILPFSIGVNGLALSGLPVIGNTLGGWTKSDAVNTSSIDTLLQWGEQFLDAMPAEDWLRAPLETLMREVREIFDGRLHHQDGGEAYKLASRVAILGQIVGAVSAYNCKSGKDRTGQLDAEIKTALISLYARESHIGRPTYNAPLSEAQKGLLTQVQLQSGNLEVQHLNTGVPGYKIFEGGRFAVQSNFSRTHAVNAVRGLSRAIHS